MSPHAPQTGDGQISEAQQDLEDALQDMYEQQDLFLGCYSIQSSLHQRGGGQALVQFALHAETRWAVAIKVRAASHTVCGRTWPHMLASCSCIVLRRFHPQHRGARCASST